MTPHFEITEGDSLPVIEAEEFLDADGEQISLTAEDTVVLRVQRSGGRDEPQEYECEVTQLSPAKAKSPALSGLVAGRYVARFVVQYAEGGQLSHPNSAEPIYIRVNPSLAEPEES